MRNLFAFLLRFHGFFLFIFLEVLALTLLVTLNDHQKNIFGSSANVVNGNIFQFFDGASSYMSLGEENKKLQKENADLKKRNKNSLFYHEILNPEELDTLFTQNIVEQQFEYLPATVINNSVSLSYNYITLDRGSKHGLEPNTGVISSQGLVGIVRKVSNNFSVVMSLLHRDMKISAKIKNSNYFGSLVWEKSDYQQMTLRAIPNHANVAPGDTVITSGFSTIFPENIPIGVVDTLWTERGDNFNTIIVQLSTDLKNTEYVYVVKNNLKEEQQKLEKEVSDE